VTRNGKIATLGDRALAGTDVVEVDGIRVENVVPPRYFVLNKPRGVISTTDDPQGRPTVIDMLPDETRRSLSLFTVGRLDMESTGLILLTNDGFLTNRITHPRFEVQREYVVVVEPVPGAEDIARLRKGVDLEDGNTGPARVSVKDRAGSRAQVRMIVHTGRKRQIRRSFSHLGYEVIDLCRVRIGSLGLGTLKPGEWRELDQGEVRGLYRQTGIST
jgi:23S rRNA pseudouridine2605 synthase